MHCGARVQRVRIVKCGKVGTDVAVDPVKYLRDVRAEVSRVRWPTRKETLVTTGMVLTMTLFTAIFFFTVDWLIGLGVRAMFGGNS